MKHPYKEGCDCRRCAKELTRRTAQSANDFTHDVHRRTAHHHFRRQNSINRRPVVGSQEWAETRGDDIDSPSGDY